MLAPVLCRDVRSDTLAADVDPAALLARHAPRLAGSDARLRKVVTEALQHPGGLFRLRLVLAVGGALGLDSEIAGQLAAAIEFFHTASLLLDDLPCMDDATERRGRPCAHTLHGEGAALLGALAFINRGYALVAAALADLPVPRRLLANQLVDTRLGPAGLIGGQARDLAFAEGPATARAVGRAAQGKTVAMLRLTLELPGLAGGADGRERQRLARLAVYWGLLYQGLDDLRDERLAAAAGAAKSDRRDFALGRPNLALAAGICHALPYLERLAGRAAGTVADLIGEGPRWSVLGPFHRQLAAPLASVSVDW